MFLATGRPRVMRRLTGRLGRGAIGVLISVACVYLVVRGVDLGKTADLLGSARPTWLALAVAAVAGDLVFRALRWQILMRPIHRVPLRRLSAYMLVGYLANNVLPARLGELVRSHYLGDREGISRSATLGTVVVERVVDTVVLVAIGALAILDAWNCDRLIDVLLMRFDVSGEPWVRRETIWNYYYLRSSQTYDDFFAEHILNQNGFYQYGMGFQGAARDPLQHCLPFLFSDPEIVRSVLRYTLKEVRDDGSVPYGLTGHGVVAPMVADNCSDIPLWLLWAVSEYVLATRDTEFLNEEISTLFSARSGQKATVRNLLARCFHHQINDVGVGMHGITRMLNDDWNDGLLDTWAATAFKECAEQGESVLNSAMSAWVFDQYARMLRFAGDPTDLEAKATESSEKARLAAREQWNGRWLKRAWLGPTLGWLGETTLWIEPQPWAIVAGILTPAQNRELVTTMNNLLRQGPIGAAQMSEGPDLHKPGAFAPGTCVRGAVWPSLNQTLIWALAGVDPQMAWDEWKKNSFARHADVYPDVWYGVWSGTDSYNSILSSHPGETVNDPYFHGTDFPVLNLHAHACSLYSITKLLNIEFTEAGLNISPELPIASYRFDSPLIGVAKSPAGHYEGWYAPLRSGNWTVSILLPEKIGSGLSQVEVNGTSSAIQRRPDGTITVTGASELHKPLRWTLR